MVNLIRSADPADPEQMWWAADLARQQAAQRWHALLSAGMAPMMLSMALLAATPAMLLAGLLVMGLHLGLLVVQVAWDRTAQAFLRRHGQPVAVPVR